jgi:drug/metabolite transporter (DMT)-like permease
VTDNLRGVLAVLVGSTAFVLNDAFVKLASPELPASQINAIRGVIATVLLAGICTAMGAWRPLSVLLSPMMLLRVGAAAAASTFIAIGLRHMPLPTLTTILQVTPLAVTAGAAIVFAERVGWRRWLAVAAGFAGVVLIVKPGGGSFGAAAYIALAALLCTTVRDLTTRGLDKGIPSLFVAAASTAAIFAGGLVYALFDAPWSAPTMQAWAYLVTSGVCLVAANVFLIIALRTGEIAVIAPFRYALVPLSLWFGWLWWGDVLDALAFMGIGLIVAAGLYTLHRERASLRAVARPALNRTSAQ